MSGGSHGYVYCSIEENLCGQMYDTELNDLMKDIKKLAHDLEWYDSSDIGEEQYFDTVAKFKQKWFKSNREQRLKSYVDEQLEQLKESLYRLIGVS